MNELHTQIDALVQRAKAASVRALTLANPATAAGDELATTLAEIARDFTGASTALRQAAREQADQEVAERPKWRPKLNAAKSAAQIIKRGGRMVAL
jgi:hypothetical protein